MTNKETVKKTIYSRIDKIVDDVEKINKSDKTVIKEGSISFKKFIYVTQPFNWCQNKL